MRIKFRTSCHTWPQCRNAGLHKPTLHLHSYQAGWDLLSTRSRLHFSDFKANTKKFNYYEVPKLEEVPAEEAVHLVRALLRETSYLPDPAAREFFHHYIIASFRRYWKPTPSSELTPSSKPTPPWIQMQLFRIQRRRIQKFREARKYWKFLVHANHGSQAHLLKVLEMTYGRRGKRKHQLMRDVVSLEVPEDDRALQELAWLTQQRHDLLEGKEPRLPAKLSALVRSQFNQKNTNFSKNNIKSLAPKIEAQNIWLRPLPKKRAANKRRKWYAETLERVVPPLPEADWTRLRDLSMGNLPWEGRRPTRTRAPGQFSSDTYAFKRDRDGHQLTPRFMQRMWGRVFIQCPVMQWNQEKQRWHVSWGRPNAGLAVAIGADSEVESGAFEDLHV